MEKDKFTEKICIKHGKTIYVLENKKQYRCKKCRSEAVSKNRKNRKLKLVEICGGKCIICGYNKCIQALEFHHINVETKDFTISTKGLCRSLEKALTEIKKCILVCANCHRELENNIITYSPVAQ